MLSERGRKANRKVAEDTLARLERGGFYGDLTFKIKGGRIYRRVWVKGEEISPDGDVKPPDNGGPDI